MLTADVLVGRASQEADLRLPKEAKGATDVLECTRNTNSSPNKVLTVAETVNCVSSDNVWRGLIGWMEGQYGNTTAC